MDIPSKLKCEETTGMSKTFLIVLDGCVGGRSDEGRTGVGLAEGWRGGEACPFG